MPINFVYISIIYKQLLGVNLPSTAHTNHHNYFTKINQVGNILQHCHVMYVTEAFKETQTKFKALDIVINNAGILADSKWELEIAVNMVSTQH
jgi:short-subunit dehydrogenase involved in D-alanine esterification of teichoic acids